MTIALFLTVIAAIAGAISAAARTYTKLKPQAAPRYSNTVQEAKSLEADQPRLQPDLDSERLEPVEVPSEVPEVLTGASSSEPMESIEISGQQETTEVSMPEVSRQQKSAEVSTIAIPPMMPIAEVEIPLATSLKISDVVDSDLSIEPQAKEEHHHYSVIDEVEQLEHIDERLNRIQHQATEPDHLMRLAAAVELGELAKQGQAHDRVITLLNQLTQDADLEVRVQAGASLAMIPVETAD
ncbi:hypothetical protein IQ250_20165 [Pseudanabaenaceae cyanobacterium LEGE 13415]|nr:hypothetical protein [Pseudanabaenaceae cyanobacterium LEGE 13415]